MKSIVFFLLLLLTVATSGQMINGWGYLNLTSVHEDGEAEVLWDSLALKKSQKLAVGAVYKGNQAVCNAHIYGNCIAPQKNGVKRKCELYTYCSRMHGDSM
ncbi:unnamed protein product [Arabidopsis thaliana]|uniref:(thale cress) hypothetical protein n=1 Tax=Arabidopsis thaliana TaxID=3702 RepID=A0A7G2FC99_ARATH|nr:unnamed protein product [Arabidopsis thaliana]